MKNDLTFKTTHIGVFRQISSISPGRSALQLLHLALCTDQWIISTGPLSYGFQRFLANGEFMKKTGGKRLRAECLFL
jgi:hypothetical protein